MAEAMKLADKMDVERFADKAKQYVQKWILHHKLMQI